MNNAAAQGNGRDLRNAQSICGAILLITGLLFPWNVYFGVGIGATNWWVFGLVVLATVLALAGIAVGRTSATGTRSGSRLVLALGVPYLLVLLSFLGFTLIQSVRHGGTGLTPPGIGPGLSLGLSGALLAIGPNFTPRGSISICRIIGIVSLALASLAVLFNLYWRLRFVVPGLADAQTSKQNWVTFVAALLYGSVTLAPVALVAYWLVKAARLARFAIVGLGFSVLLAGVTVWLLPVGRQLDAFHGIAQNTSTAGVGFEGFLAWVAAATILGSAMPSDRLGDDVRTAWSTTARRVLALILLWCGGSALLRIIDIASAAVLDLPAPPYNSAMLMVFDLAVAIVAGWLMINGFNVSLPGWLRVLLPGIIVVLTVARLVLGVTLIPRVTPLGAKGTDDVFGNTLAQQITSTFDVALCFLAAALFVVTVLLLTGRLRPQHAEAPGRSDPRVSEEPRERVAAVLAESTNRFAAGTVYGAESSNSAKAASKS